MFLDFRERCRKWAVLDLPDLLSTALGLPLTTEEDPGTRVSSANTEQLGSDLVNISLPWPELSPRAESAERRKPRGSSTKRTGRRLPTPVDPVPGKHKLEACG